MIWVVHPGTGYRIRNLFYPSGIPDPGVKKASDPGSRIRSAKLKKHYIFYSAKIYHNKEKSIFVFMPKNLAWTQQRHGLNVTITSKVVVYASAERAKKLLYPFLLCGDDCGKGSGMPILYSLYSLPTAGISG
jgi:hypothetical protein